MTETTLNGSRFVVDDEDVVIFFGLNEDEDEGVISFWWCIERTKRRQSFAPLKKIFEECFVQLCDAVLDFFKKATHKLKNTNNTSEASA